MAKQKLFEDIKTNPARFYRMPSDVIRDRRFRDNEQLEILQAWESEASSEDGDSISLLQQVTDAKKELERRSDTASR